MSAVIEVLGYAALFAGGYLFARLSVKAPRKGDRFICEACSAVNQVSSVGITRYTTECGRCHRPKVIEVGTR